MLFTAFNMRGSPKPIRLENIKTGLVVSASSLTQFCEKTGLKLGGNISLVNRGKRLGVKDWYSPKILNLKLRLKDKYGAHYTMTIREWTTKYGYRPEAAMRLLSGKTRVSYKGIMLASTPIKTFLTPRNQEVIEVRLRRGEEILVAPNLKAAALKAGLCYSSFYPLARGEAETCNGYRLEELKTRQKSVLRELEGVN